ncbi:MULTISPECIES: putative aminohydrolase SsnA [unclassified Oceanispirochaeta]|uniref:putative aminohydrolase SsnA n=1 Tax=unclassified Oceanispirochaeta TaxID=2635722 RepID=UPI000E091718|nr:MULTISPECIES: putative aminohydrolase SsnA [unclassified Oceanispirochaeta]MBF9015751.1 putative aminohydrolase SsnA [Oceanispirochaeta sp. M2]NPD72214.1 putative aminohydrolase SsnA [Oceanispirochaeta sp. M1]RDG32312.1 putative aminohydrolase SsnA [Oceanispirochaeta sp. M1]
MLIIKNATVVNFSPPEVFQDWDIVIDGDQIAAAGPGAAEGLSADEVWDLKGGIVHPGLVCSHNHFYSGLARGILADIPPSPDFISTLKNLWWRLDRAIDKDILKSSGQICCLDAIRNGTTAVIDHHASPSFLEGSLSVLKDTFEETGLRGMSCYETSDRNGLAEMKAGIAENIRMAQEIDKEKSEGKWKGLFECHIGAHAPFTVPEEGLKLLSDAVESTGRGLHIHVAEDRYDVAHSHHHYSEDLLVRLDRHGLLNSKAIVAHGLYLSEEERKILNERNSFLVANFRSNMNNNVGSQKNIGSYKNAALGTDGMGTDMWEELKFAYFKHKDEGGPLWPGDFLNFLHNGNTILERNFDSRFGRIEKGFKADIVVSDYNAPTPLKAENIAGHIAFGQSASSVRSVIIEGKVVLKDREFPFDVSSIYKTARDNAARLWEKMNSIEP